jgi:hypothetical protein
MMKRTLIVLLAAALTQACSYGMTTETFTPAFSAGGVGVDLMTSSVEFRGELIEVQDAGLVILTSRRGSGKAPTPERLLRLVPYGAIRSAKFDQLGSGYRVSNQEPPQPEVRARLRRVSRFPHGLAPDLLRQLLESCGQSQLAGVEP